MAESAGTGPQRVAAPQGFLERRLGGTLGAHARRLGGWLTAGPWAFLAALVCWLVLVARQIPCRQTDVLKPVNTFFRLCYTDIPILYQARNLQQGASPYSMEYPVLTGAFISVSRSLAQLFGARVGPGVGGQVGLDGANIFFAVNAVLLFGCFLVTVAATLGTVRTRPFDALMVAAAPAVAAAGLINWDLFVVALTAVGVWAWSRRYPATAGVLLGLAVAAKLYPVLLFVPLLALCLRTRKVREFGTAAGAAAVAWTVPNVLLFAHSPADWLYFWTFNVGRGGDLGSIWYVLGLMGASIPGVSAIIAVLMLGGAALVAALGLLAPRRPRFAQLAFLLVCWFLIVNKVYSPQYVIWLLPFVVLARPRWRDWAIWTVAELCYFAAIWGHLAGTMYAVGSTQDRIYWMSVALRLGVQVWLMWLVVGDVLHPERDLVRAGGADDPTGGVFDGADDAAWIEGGRVGVLGLAGDDGLPADPDDWADEPAPERVAR